MATARQRATGKIFKHIIDMMAAQTVSTFAQFGIADVLKDKELTASDIASAIETNADATRRLLRAVCALGYVHEKSEGQEAYKELYCLTDEGHYLRSDIEGSLRASIISETDYPHRLGWSLLKECVKVGDTCLDQKLGMDVWKYYKENTADGAMFAIHMSGLTMMSVAAITAAYNFEGVSTKIETIVDVGGSEGALLAGFLGRFPDARGVVFDLPEVAERTSQNIPAQFVGRMTAQGGDFFQSVPEGDVFLLKFILHDWGNDACVSILKNIAKAMRPGAVLAVAESFVSDNPATASDPMPYCMDINMLAMCRGGRERTTKEYASLLSAAGLKLVRTVSTASHFYVLEAVKESAE